MAGSSFVLLSAVAMALKDTLSKAASMSRNTPRTYLLGYAAFYHVGDFVEGSFS